MQEFGGHDQEFFKSLIPKARSSIRNTNLLQTNNFYSLKHCEGLLQTNNMDSKQRNSSSSDTSDNEIQYTDSEDDGYEQNDNSSRYSNRTLNNSSQNLLLESFSSTHNYPFDERFHEQSFRNRNTNQSANVTVSPPYQRRHGQPHEKLKAQYYNILLYSFTCIVIISIIYIITSNKNINQETVKNTEVKARKVHLIKIGQMLDKSMEIVQAQFYNQKPSIWNDMSAAIYDVILYPKKPSIIVLFGKEANTLNCLAQLLGQLGGVVLGNKDYLILTPHDFANDVGQVIYNLRIQILQKPSVIIQDLLSINTEAIKAFHNFCDREAPLVENAIYIITMVVDDYTVPQKELEFVEKRLVRKLSGKIEKDILDPLITRLTDGIIVPILPESSTSFNRSRCSFPNAQINKLRAVIS